MPREIDFKSLLPIKGIDISLRCLSTIYCQPFHYPAMTAWLRYLLDIGDEYEKYFCIGLAESGKTEFRKGDYYHLRIVMIAPPDALVEYLFRQLQQLPGSLTHQTYGAFGRNLTLVSIKDSFSLKNVTQADQLLGLDEAHLTSQAEALQSTEQFIWRWDSFVRLKKKYSPDRYRPLKGDNRFCRDSDDFSAELLMERVFTMLATLVAMRSDSERPRLGDLPKITLTECDTFWLDNYYLKNENSDPKSIGGACGELVFAGRLDLLWWRYVILLHWLGMGQQRIFGLGRFSLLTLEGASLLNHRPEPALYWSQVLHQARYLDLALEHSDGSVQEPLPDKPQLRQMVTTLLNRDYEVPVLQGCILNKDGRAPRALAYPPLADRVLQRVVLHVLQSSCEKFFDHASYGYRPAHSRQQARDEILKLVKAGYRWVFESDIEDFFDTLDRKKLAMRLRYLLNDDCLVHYLLAWMSAPVEYQGERIERSTGIPQGSPLSPLMANLMLDDFDNDLKLQGFKLVRFADDFVILCKNKKRAEQAQMIAEKSLGEHGLALNPDKTHITEIDHSIQFLGYLFVNETVLDNPKRSVSSDRSVPPRSWLAEYQARMAAKAENPGDPEAEEQPDIETDPPLVIEPPQADYISNETDEGLMPETDDESVLVNHAEASAPAGLRDGRGTGIYISGDPCIVRTSAHRVVVQRGDNILTDTPWTAVNHLILFGHHQMTSQAVHQACEHDIAIHHATGMGRYVGVTCSPAQNSASQRLQQRQLQLDETQQLQISRALVVARIRSCREILRRRSRPEHQALQQYQQQAGRAASLMQLRGYEGMATRCYFAVLQEILPDWAGFTGRNRQPPQDPFNALLSLGYTMLYGFTDSLLRASHLLSWAGVYHQPGGRHAALASDMMEPFRYLVERTALTLVNKKILTEADFESRDGGIWLLSQGRQRYLTALLQALNAQKTAVTLSQSSIIDHIQQQITRYITSIRSGEVFEAWHSR
ncbi:CRISPR-associated endonuclease Cas1 [Vibrio spartinae]|uniref:CRISPR-associated endonuclease Cas1 n=1 Tax=Vibrio spartinae TaxID=1918945 RepID=A0ABX6R3H5_9VIBR|nr:CRISPR-associated endonuclease Cas1 [Vibrio spartinae]QMV15984.1 CRISPR-associated endonuclease Cas1 [Vibrio spartinae]